MAKYKIEGLSFNGGEDLKKEEGKMKADVNFSLDLPDDLSLSDQEFTTAPIKVKKEFSKAPIEVKLVKKKNKKGNELI